MSWSQFFRDAAISATTYNSFKINEKLVYLSEVVKESAERTNSNIEKLSQDINNNLSAISLELALQSSTFNEILNILKNKRKADAEELKNNGIFALRNGWLDDAESDLLQSLKINRYDYQVYYLLAKIYASKESKDTQEEYLKKAFQYSSQDVKFQQYILMDIIAMCIEKGDNDAADTILNTLQDIYKSTPLCLIKAMRDIKFLKVSDDTFIFIEKAIENYESENPSKVIEVVTCISKLMSENDKINVEKILNKTKRIVTYKTSKAVSLRVNNLLQIIKSIKKECEHLVNNTPEVVIKKVFSKYWEIEPLLSKLDILIKKLNNISIDSYQLLSSLLSILKQFEENTLNRYKTILTLSGIESQGPSFKRLMDIDLDYSVGNEDKIIVQCKLDSGIYLSLTYFKILITKDKKLIGEYDLFDFQNLNKLELETEYQEVSNKKISQMCKVPIIKFYLIDELNKHIIAIDKSSTYHLDHVVFHKNTTQFEFLNILTLLWNKASLNCLFLNFMRQLNMDFTLLEWVLNYGDKYLLEAVKLNQSGEVEFIEGDIKTDTDIEFID